MTGRRRKGKGLLDFFKKGVAAVSDTVDKVKDYFSPNLSSYNNATNKALVTYGNKIVESLTIYRQPITEFFNGVLNTVSFGKWNQLRNKYGFDKMFHLSLVAKLRDVNDLISIEKLDRVSVSKDVSKGAGLETLSVPLHGKQFTLLEMLEKARSEVGDKAFFEYDAFRNNCQWFISYLLKGQGLYGEKEKAFVFQDISKIVAELPSYVTQFQRGVTDLTATFNKITGGKKRRGGARPAHEAAERKDHELGSVHADLQQHNRRILMVREIHRIMRRLLPYGIVTQDEMDEVDGDMDLDDLEEMLQNAREMEEHYEPMIRQDERQHAYRQRRGRGMSGGAFSVEDMLHIMVHMYEQAVENGFVDANGTLLEILEDMHDEIEAGTISAVDVKRAYKHFMDIMDDAGMSGGGMSGGMDPHERKDESKESKEEKEPQEENKDEMDDRKHADSDSDDDMGSERVQYSDSDSDSDMDSQRAQRGRGMSGGMEIDLPYSSSKGYHRYGFGMSGGNFDGPAVINHMQRMLRDLQQVVVVPNHILARLFNITVNWEQGNVTQAELVDFYRAFTSMYRDFFPAVGGSIFDTPIIQQGDPRRIFPSPKLDIRDTMKPLRF